MKNIILIVSTLLATSAFAQTDLVVTAIPNTDITQWEYERSYTLYDASGAALIDVPNWVDNQVDTANVPDGNYVLVLEDSYGDGWEGALLNVSVGNTTLMVGGGFDDFTLVQAIDITNGELSTGLLDTDACLDPTACNFLESGDCVNPEPLTNCDGTPIDAIVIDCTDEFGWLEVLDILYEEVDSLGNVTFGAGFQEFILSADGTTMDAGLAGLFYFNGTGFVGECGNGYEGCLLTISGYDGELNEYVTPEEQELLDIIDDLNEGEQELLDIIDVLAEGQQALLDSIDGLQAQVDSLTGELQDCSENILLTAELYYQYGYEAGDSIGYAAGYADGLEDCEGEVNGLVDIDGNTVIPVVGYYNELGQVIDPRRHNGLIIRRHADGTFSKYIKQLR